MKGYPTKAHYLGLPVECRSTDKTSCHLHTGGLYRCEEVKAIRQPEGGYIYKGFTMSLVRMPGVSVQSSDVENVFEKEKKNATTCVHHTGRYKFAIAAGRITTLHFTSTSCEDST